MVEEVVLVQHFVGVPLDPDETPPYVYPSVAAAALQSSAEARTSCVLPQKQPLMMS